MNKKLIFLDTKRIFIWCFIFLGAVLLFTSVANADIISALSEEYSIWGTYRGYVPPVTSTFQETSSDPIYQYTVVYREGDASMEATASGGVDSESAWVYTHTFENDFVGFISGHALASITFSPLVSTMLVSTYGTYGVLKVIDLTSGLTLLDSGSSFPYHSDSSLMSFNLSHIYTISAESGTAWLWDINGYLSIESVPEPATMLLLGLGLVGLAGVRRKFRK